MASLTRKDPAERRMRRCLPCAGGRSNFLPVLAKNDPHKLKLKRDEFDDLVKAVHGSVRQKDVADALHLHPSHWSDIRAGRRWFNPCVADAMLLLPGIATQAYARAVPVTESQS